MNSVTRTFHPLRARFEDSLFSIWDLTTAEYESTKNEIKLMSLPLAFCVMN